MRGGRGALGRLVSLRGTSLAVLAVSCVLPLRADVIDQVAARYARDGGVGGRFEQRLISPGGRERVYEGRYHYSSGQGLIWEVTAPDRGELIIDGNGDARVSGELGGLSVFRKRTVGRLIVAMVSLDESVLERYYTISQAGGPKGFEIKLEARTRWRKVAGTITIRGASLVDAVRMELPDGRIMALSLTHDR